MRLSRLRIENHRRLADLEIAVRNHLVLVGANDAGKSSLLRCIDLLLGASTAQLYASISSEDFRFPDRPLTIEGTLEDFTDRDKALFPDEIHIDPTTLNSRLTIRLTATLDETETLTITRSSPDAGTNRQLSRDQYLGLGWKFLSATTSFRDLREGRKSPVDDILQSVDLGEEQETFNAVTENLADLLRDSGVLARLRNSLSNQLSKALPYKVTQSDLTFVPGATAEGDVLSDVRLQVNKHGVPHDLSEQSDGTRALYAIALYDLMSEGANIVGIDEPEIHLHPSSQRSLARLLQQNTNQKIIATHSTDIVEAFDPDFIVVVRQGGAIVQPKAGFLADKERTKIRLWVRNKLEPLTSRRVVFVEGISDRIILERLAELTGRHLDRLGVSVIETNGSGDMGPIEKLFGENGFCVPLSRLIDADAEEDLAKNLGVDVSDLGGRSVWVSRSDLEDEYVHALGADSVWEALNSSGYFTKNRLSNCAKNGPDGRPTEIDVATFCRGKKNKVDSALSVLPLFNETNAKCVTSIEGLLEEISSLE